MQLTRTTVLAHQTLGLVRDLGRGRWRFCWRGFIISGAFAENGTLVVGETIDADLEVTQKLNALGIWENSRYRVVKVHDVFRTPQNERLLREE